LTSFQDFFILATSIIVGSAPFILLGTLLSVLLQNYASQSFLLKILPKHSHTRRFVLSLFGILLPVCECGNVPLARGLVVRGISPADATVFLLAAPIVNPITIVTTYQVFGWENGILIARILGGLAIANLIAWLFSLKADQSTLLTSEFNATCRHSHGSHEKTSHPTRIAVDFTNELIRMFKPLIIGAGIAGAIQILVPREVLSTIGNNPVLSVIVMLFLAIIISICSTVDSFFALSFASTFLPGAIVAFLVAGPLIDIRMIALLKTTYTAKSIALIVGVVLLSSFILAQVVNLLVV